MRFTYVVACIRTVPFYCWVVFHCMAIPYNLFFCSPIDGESGCFQFWDFIILKFLRFKGRRLQGSTFNIPVYQLVPNINCKAMCAKDVGKHINKNKLGWYLLFKFFLPFHRLCYLGKGKHEKLPESSSHLDTAMAPY